MRQYIDPNGKRILNEFRKKSIKLKKKINRKLYQFVISIMT